MELTSTEDITLRLKRVISEWRPELKLRHLTGLTPDASLRRYFRVEVEGFTSASLLAMWFDSVQSPEADGGSVRADMAYVELARFFSSHNVAVPELYHDAHEDSLLLVEDLGDSSLASFLFGTEVERVRKYVLAAIDEIVAIQNIPPDTKFFAYQRSFSADLYLREMGEFVEFLLGPKTGKRSEIAIVEMAMSKLAEILESQPRVLSHRDFHAWNLMIDSHDHVRVIDFQDALLASRSYDLVSLLNDRDVDSLLGPELYRSALEHFRRGSGACDSFYNDYDQVLLQRDLKVAGRFEKLATVRGLNNYRKWIPGTVRRIGSTLERIIAQNPGPIEFTDTLEILSAHFPDIKRGAEKKLRFAAGNT